ncbi:MAG: esterase-like activity of phytase family protein, partial [Corynebacterium flavescens]
GQWATGYPEGGGAPDAEGIVAARNGDIYLATERNNEDKKASRPSILRFANPTGKEGTQNAQQERNLAKFTGDIQPNGGLEALAQLEDDVFAAGVEETGDVLVVDLSQGEPRLMQRYSSPFKGVMALDYSAASKQLSVLCDEICGGASQVLNWDGNKLSESDGKVYERPEKMGNFANEGFDSHTDQVECEAGGTVTVTSFLWADDAATDGVSLRSAQVRHGDCAPKQPTPPTESSLGSSSTDFSAGSVVGALVAALAGVGLVGALGAILPQLLKAFPALKAFLRL